MVLGGTRGMGRQVARGLAARGDAVFLLGRDPQELERSARDLEHRGAPAKVGHGPCDLLEPATFGAALDRADQALGGFDTVVIAAGLFGTQEALEEDPARTARVLTADLTNTVLLCEAVRERLLERGGGTLCVFSSVAGDRGRASVGIYGAAKAGLSHYLEALDHRYRRRGLRTVCVKPGFVRTAMTAGLPEPPFASDPSAVAPRVIRALERGTPVVYVPGIWALVVAVVRRLPRAVMRRVSF